MRIVFALLAVVAAGSFMSTKPAKADPYRWCAIYGGGNGGQNCGFVTLAQCRATISGDNRAVCVRNPFYDGRPIR